jgi:hypothetical protein
MAERVSENQGFQNVPAANQNEHNLNVFEAALARAEVIGP